MARPAQRQPSSTLLTEIMQRPLDPGYAAAARRREAAAREAAHPAGDHPAGDPARDPSPDPGSPASDDTAGTPPGGPAGTPRGTGPGAAAARRPWTRRRGAVQVVVAGVLLGLVTGAGVAQLRSRPLQAQDRAVLEAEIQRRTTLADELAEANEELRAEIEVEQAQAIGEGASALLEATDRLAVVTGAVAVTGDGVVVELDDAPSDGVADTDAIADDSRVRDVDVQTIVNGLWSAGAEAVSVNDQRLTSLSTIRHAGDAIVVDLRQLARPYTITAIGDPDRLLEEARTGSAGQWSAFLRDSYGIPVSVEAADDLRLPPASRLTLRHAQAVTGADDQPVPDGPVQEDDRT